MTRTRKYKPRTYKACDEQIVLDRLADGTLKVDVSGGRVLVRRPNGRWAVPYLERDRCGYLFFRLYRNGARRKIALHRAVWMAANGTLIPAGHEVHHVNVNNQVNAHWNLEAKDKDAHRLVHAGVDYPSAWDDEGDF